jgi:hypothetical protein
LKRNILVCLQSRTAYIPDISKAAQNVAQPGKPFRQPFRQPLG